MSTCWEEKKLKSILKLEYGKPLDVTHRSPSGLYPAYGANGEKTRTNKFYFDKPSIVVGRKGSAGEIKLTEEKFWPLDVTYFVTFNEKEHDLRFLYYLLSKLELPKLAKGVKPGINRNDVYEKKISVPRLQEQKRLVTLLDKSFEAINTALANTKKSLENAKELFQSYLNGVFEQGGEGWIERKLGDISLINMGQSPKGNTYNLEAKGVPLINGPVDFSQHPFGKTLLKKFTTSPKKICEKNDLILCVRGSTTGRINIAGCKSCIGRGVASIRATKVLQQWINYFIFASREKIYELGTGSTFPNISGAILNKLTILVPSQDVQLKTIRVLNYIWEDTSQLQSIYQKKLTALEELKQSLLHQAFNGNL